LDDEIARRFTGCPADLARVAPPFGASGREGRRGADL